MLFAANIGPTPIMVHYEGLNLGLQLKRSAREEGSHNDQLTKMFLARTAIILRMEENPPKLHLMTLDDSGWHGIGCYWMTMTLFFTGRVFNYYTGKHLSSFHISLQDFFYICFSLSGYSTQDRSHSVYNFMRRNVWYIYVVDIHHNDLLEEGNPWLANPNIKIWSDFYSRICSGRGWDLIMMHLHLQLQSAPS